MPALPPVDGATTVPSLRTLGTGSKQALAGDTAFQPLDSDLTAIAALATTSFGRSLLIEATATSARTTLGIPTAVGGAEWTIVTKTIDESNSSNTVLQTDDELFFTGVSGAFYEIEAYIIYASPAGAGTPDIKITIGEDNISRGVLFSASIGTGEGLQTATSLARNDQAQTEGTVAGKRALHLWVAYGAGGGTISVYWAQNTSGSNATIIYTGSVLRYRRIL